MKTLGLILPLAACLVFGQTPTGTIQGIVADSSGAVVPGCRVRITNIETNEVKELSTDGSGRYLQPFLLPGTYAVSAEQDGFRPARQDKVKLDVGQNRSVDFRLEIGAVTQEVDVTAAAPPLDTNTSSVGQVIEHKRILDLPLNGRSVFALAALTPGVNPTGGGATPHMGGGRNAISELQIDGVTDIAPENNVGINARVYEPQVDAVEEFSVQINSLAAEYGRFGGGVINVVTKSGTNKLHGTAYEFLRNSTLDANNFFANRAGRSKGSFKRNQWGGTVGGPLAKDRTFFFAAFEGTSERSQSVFTGTVPLPAWRTGDYSDLRTAAAQPILIYDPLTVREDPGQRGRFIRNPFAGNRLPQARLNPVATAAMRMFPAPNAAPSNPYTAVNNFVNAGSIINDSYRTDARVDHNWTPAWRMFARASVGWGERIPYNQFENPGTPSADGPSTTAQRNVSFDNTVTLSPTLIANLRYGFGRTWQRRLPFSDGFDPTSIGLPQYLKDAAAREGFEFPKMAFSGIVSELGQARSTRLLMIPMVHSASASITKIRSRHTLKAGGEYRKLLINFAQSLHPSSSYVFSRAWTQEEIVTSSATRGFPLASFLLGLPASGNISHDPMPASSSSYFGVYVQDDWKVSSKLTLNIGLRYDMDRPRTERYNRYSVFDIDAASPIAGKVPGAACPSCADLRGAMRFVGSANRRQMPADRNNFGPRFGFAWSPGAKLAVRGGYGITYAPSALQAAGTTGAAGMQGFRGSTELTSTLDSMRTIYATLSNPFPDGFNFPAGAANGPATDLGLEIRESLFDAYRNSFIQQWSLNIQRQLPGDLVFEIGYLGNRGLGLVDGDGGQSYSQLPASMMSMRAELLRVVANPFAGVITNPTSPLSQSTVQLNQLLRRFPQYTNVSSFRKPIASSMYHGMTIRADKRFSKGFSFLVAYTAGKLMDDASSAVNFLGPIANSRLDAYNRRLEWSVSSMDVAQRFVASYLYEFPFGRSQRFLAGLPGALNVLVSGWQVNGITTLQSGTPVFITGAPNQTGIFSGQRPDNNGKSARITGGTTNERLNRWFDTTTFSIPAAYTFGTLGRTLPDVRNPGQQFTDLSLFKNTPLGADRRLNLQYRLEMFNAFNTPQFGSPGSDMLAAGFGVISSTAGAARQVQMALKLIW